jgi:hypothetical protein
VDVAFTLVDAVKLHELFTVNAVAPQGLSFGTA